MNENLSKLQTLIYKKPQSVKDIAKKLKCARTTIYNRIGRLMDAGAGVAIESKRQGARGPESVIVSVTRRA